MEIILNKLSYVENKKSARGAKDPSNDHPRTPKHTH